MVASCDNCRLQLSDRNDHYGLGVRISGLMDLVVNAYLAARGTGQRVAAPTAPVPASR